MAIPLYPLTQFTPAPSCGIGSSLWAVSKTCYMYARDPTPANQINPPWMTCTAVQAGEPPDKFNRACYNHGGNLRAGDDGVTSIFSACPVGYTAASSFVVTPFYRTFSVSSGTATITRTPAIDVVKSNVYCCPSASGFHYKYYLGEDASITTVNDGTTFSGNSYLMPRCRATRVAALSGQTVTLTPYSDTMAWERRRRRQEETGTQRDPTALITEAWDDAKTVYADHEFYDVTVFADGHRCYTDCSDYWLNSYTIPDSWVPTTTTAGSDSTTTTTTTGPDLSGMTSAGSGGSSGQGQPVATSVGTSTESGQGPASTSGAYRMKLSGKWAKSGALLITMAAAAALGI